MMETILCETADARKRLAPTVALACALIACASVVSGETTPPAFIAEKAQIWFDATDPTASHLVGSDPVTAWYDRRETNLTTPTYVYAGVGTNSWATGPCVTNLFGANVLYFRGYGSGAWMRLLDKTGAQIRQNKIRHTFVVYAGLDNKGTLLGSWDASQSSYTVYDSSNSRYYWASEWGAMVQARHYLDGRRCDAIAEYRRTGVHLIETASPVWFPGQLFGALASTAGGQTASGGEGLAEVIVFTQALTETERLTVEDYLLSKWNIPSADPIAVAAGGSVTNTVADGIAVQQAAYEGLGRVVKKGAGTLQYRARESEDFRGTLRVEEGDVMMQTPVALDVKAGEKITVGDGIVARVTRTAAAASENIEKDGTGQAVLAEVPAEAHCIKVNAGELAVRAPKSDADDVEEEVYIENHDFEDWKSELEANGDIGSLKKLGGALKAHGWTSSDNFTWIYTQEVWTNKSSTSTASGTVLSQWQLDGDQRTPPDGPVALFFRGASWRMIYAETTVEIQNPGVFELSFYAYKRGDSEYARGQASLVDGSGNTVADFGPFLVDDDYYWKGKWLVQGYRLKHLRAYVPAAGTYKLRLGNAAISDNDLVAIDGVHLKRVPGADRIWKIPGGSFEDAQNLRLANYYMSNIVTVAGWTFQGANGDGFYSAKRKRMFPAVGISARTLLSDYKYYDQYETYNPSKDWDSEAQLLFLTNGTATVSCTPPAGQHYLRASLAFYANATPNGSFLEDQFINRLTATVTTSQGSVTLGTVLPKNKKMTDITWPVPFETTGEAVTITFTHDLKPGQTYRTSGIWMDDAVLVEETPNDLGPELLSHASLWDSYSKWTLKIESSEGGTPSRKSQYRPYSFSDPIQIDAFGLDILAFRYFVELGETMSTTVRATSSVSQSVEIPEPGRYRFAYHSHARVNEIEGWKSLPPACTEAVLERGDTKLLVGVTENLTTNYTRNVFYVDVPEAGTWTYKVRMSESDWVKYSGRSVTPCANLDGFSLRRAPVSAAPREGMPFDGATRIEVADKARLRLDFTGTNKVQRVRLAGQAVPRGAIVSAETYPGVIFGTGALQVTGSGFVFFLR